MPLSVSALKVAMVCVTRVYVCASSKGVSESAVSRLL